MKRELKGPILLTGGFGFIGSHMAETLRLFGYEIVKFDRTTGRDVANFDDLISVANDWKIGAIFNLAGVLGTSELNSEEMIRDAVSANVMGAINCLAVAREFEIPMLQVSKPNPWLNTYSITKRAAEDFAKLYVKEHRVKVWIVRWFNIFGPGQHYGMPRKLAPTTIVQALRNEPITIYGDGEQTVDHIYVKEAVTATMGVFETDELMGVSVEIGSGEDMTVNEFVEQVLRITNSKSTVSYLPMRNGEEEGARICANTRLLRDKAHFIFTIPFETALRQTIDWYAERFAK